MKKFFSKLFGNIKPQEIELPKVDLENVLSEIKKVESEKEIEPGRLIYKFVHLELDLQLDIEITGTYRLVAFIGNEKRYSFSIRCKKGEYELLNTGLGEALNFLDSERQIAALPKTELVRGHYFAGQEN